MQKKYTFILGLLTTMLTTEFMAQQYTSNDWIESIEVSKWPNYTVDVESYLNEAKKSPKAFEILIVREYSTTNAYNNILRDFDNGFDSLKQNSKINIPDLRTICFPNFSISKFGIKIIQPEEVTTFRCNFLVNNKKFSSTGRSNIILCANQNDSLVKMNSAELDLVRKKISNELSYFEFGGVKNEEDFCWKLQQLMYFLDELPEPNIKNMKLSRSSIIVDLGLSSNLSDNVQLKIYNNNFNNFNYNVESKKSFQISLLKRINGEEIFTLTDLSRSNKVEKIAKYNPLRVSLGLHYSYSNQIMTSNADNLFDQIIKQQSLNEISQLNVYGSNVKERFVISNHRIGAEFRMEKERNETCKDGIKYSSFGMSFIPYSIIGSYFDAEIISGEFSYKGKSDGISDEIENVSTLGLENNVTLDTRRSSSGLFTGLGTVLRLFYSFGTDKIGFSLYPFLSLESLKNKSDFSGNYTLTKNKNDYTPSLYNIQKMRNTNFGLGFSLQFPIGQ